MRLYIFVKRHRNIIMVSIMLIYIACFVMLGLRHFVHCSNGPATANNSQLTGYLNKYEYAVLVLTGPDNEAKRDAIRATWFRFRNNIYTENGEILYKWNNISGIKQQNRDLVKLLFVIGIQHVSDEKLTQLETEHNRSNDLLLLDNFEDGYKNLASKLLISLKWISANMRRLKYLIKCDDDTFIRIDLVVTELEAYAPTMNDPAISEYVSFKNNLPSYKGLYWGYFNGRANVYLSGKWEETDWFLCDNYLPYALGGGYVISRYIIDYIAMNADYLTPYNSEDVSMGVWTASLNGINRVHDIRFDTEWRSRGCSKEMLVRHKQTPSDMFQLYKSLILSQGKRLCKTETTERRSYMYKWNVHPSMCCE